MIKVFAAFAILTVMISTASVYNLKQATYDLEEKKRDISAQILKDREAIKVLKAEMAYLSRPERLERLGRRHLALESTATEQIAADITELTVRDNVQLVKMPVDNFQLLLPRQKPSTIVAVNNPQTRNITPLPKVGNSVMQKAENRKVEQRQQENRQQSLYDRILAKLGN